MAEIKKSSQRSSKSSGTNKIDEAPKVNAGSFPVVGIGASAGGLEALQRLLGSLSKDTGLAFVVIQHLDPAHESALSVILSRGSPVPVEEATDKVKIAPNHVYIIPPNTSMELEGSVLRLLPRALTHGLHMPIDVFFTSLANKKTKAIGVVLSGSGSDGALGLQTIKAEEGITFAQDQESAKYGQMPLSAVATGCVDFVLNPEEIAKELIRISQHPYVKGQVLISDTHPSAAPSDAFVKVINVLQKHSRVDFTHYKHTTLKRRALRRMVLHKMDSLDAYLELLEKSPAEREALYNDFLINVTHFFQGSRSLSRAKSVSIPSYSKTQGT